MPKKIIDKRFALKLALKQRAVDILEARITSANNAMIGAQLSANEEGKSSAGDKYETSRAMAQIERDIHAKQTESAKKDLNAIQNIQVEQEFTEITTGSFVETENEKYFFLCGLGPLDFNGEKIIFLSLNSPLGKMLGGKKKNEKITFNGKPVKIVNLF